MLPRLCCGVAQITLKEEHEGGEGGQRGRRGSSDGGDGTGSGGVKEEAEKKI